MGRFDQPIWWILLGATIVASGIIRGGIALSKRKKKPHDPN